MVTGAQCVGVSGQGKERAGRVHTGVFQVERCMCQGRNKGEPAAIKQLKEAARMWRWGPRLVGEEAREMAMRRDIWASEATGIQTLS